MSKTIFVDIDQILKTSKISFDADGVLVNSGAAVIDVFNDLFKTDYGSKDVYGWFAIAEWAILAGASEEEALDLNERLWTDPEILFKSPPIPGAVEFTRKIYQENSDFSVITSRLPSLRESTIAWFQKWMPWIRPEKINIREDSRIHGDDFKVNRIKESNVRIHFEDQPDHAKMILDKTNACVVFMPYIKELLNLSNDRLIQILPANNPKTPNFRQTYEALRSQNLYVAQY